MTPKYSKPILSRKQFIEESGYPEAYVDRALHCKYAKNFAFRSSDAINAKYMIDTEQFEWYRKEGCFV